MFKSNDPNCDIDVQAYINTVSKTTIFICLGFFADYIPSMGAEISQSSTILHEFTHLILEANDYSYEAEACEALAVLYPEKAIKNAENYNFFVASFPS